MRSRKWRGSSEISSKRSGKWPKTGEDMPPSRPRPAPSGTILEARAFGEGDLPAVTVCGRFRQRNTW
jgi:hypothetical protein